jgi:hypothetical protein
MHGCMLYWAEGAKSRNFVASANSDPHMMTLFLRFLRDCYGVTDDRVALAVNCHVNNGLSAPTQEYAGMERPEWLDLR